MIEKYVRLIGYQLAAFALVVCAHTTWACSSRVGGTAGSKPAQPGRGDEPVVSAIVETARIGNPVDDCALIPPPGDRVATIGLTDRIDPSNAPRPTNPSERLLFSQVYETLVRVDCMGRVQPGLASSWRLDERSGFLWIVTLRENARFSDGTSVTAADVRAGWIRDGTDRQFPSYVSRLIAGVDIVDDRTLAIQLSTFRSDAPAALAHPALAGVRRVTGSPWPLGTRSNRLTPGGDTVRTVGRSELTIDRTDLPPLRFLLAPGDPRDLLDAGVDLLLTRDPATLDYAALLPHLQRVPLAWQRTYIFLTPARTPLSPSPSENARQALAADAVRGEARGAQGPFWFDTSGCQIPTAERSPRVPTPRIVYDATDEVARDLAGRFVALALAPGSAATSFIETLLPNQPRLAFEHPTGLTGDALAKARREGTDAGYIVPVQSRPLEPCSELDALKESVPWIGPWTILPLVDTRLQAVVRRGRSGLTTEFDGTVLIDDPNPRSR